MRTTRTYNSRSVEIDVYPEMFHTSDVCIGVILIEWREVEPICRVEDRVRLGLGTGGYCPLSSGDGRSATRKTADKAIWRTNLLSGTPSWILIVRPAGDLLDITSVRALVKSQKRVGSRKCDAILLGEDLAKRTREVDVSLLTIPLLSAMKLVSGKEGSNLGPFKYLG